MILAVDIGNTRTTYGVFAENELAQSFSQPTASFTAHSMNLAEELLAIGVPSDVLIASVVPAASPRAHEELQRLFPSARVRALKNTDVPIINRYRHPEQVGIDRLLGALAGHTLYAKAHHKPLIAIDLGTATTFDCVTAAGEYLGGVIALGIESSAKHLSSIAAQLPPVDLTFPEHALGRSTMESMQSGILYGAVDAIEGMIRRLTTDGFSGGTPVVVATGGLAHLLRGHTTVIDHIDRALVLRGIALTYSSL